MQWANGKQLPVERRAAQTRNRTEIVVALRDMAWEFKFK